MIVREDEIIKRSTIDLGRFLARPVGPRGQEAVDIIEHLGHGKPVLKNVSGT